MGRLPQPIPMTVGPSGRDQAVYWGDIHCHCNLGVAYSKGSVERLYRTARSHLDVLCFTPHGWWHDMDASHVPGPMYDAHAQGFETTQGRWPDVQRLCRTNYQEGAFVTLLGYEWHSSRWGDHCVVFPADRGPYFRAPDLDALKAFARQHNALLIPHHVAYRPVHRGYDWSTLDQTLTPVVEIYSEHGLSETEPSILPYVAHSPGPACTLQTVGRALADGKRFGLVANSDGHFGYPGSWGEGLTGFMAEALTRDAVLDALRHRRTLAVTGDRITPWLHVEDGRAEYHASLCAPLMLLEIVRNGDVVHVHPQPPEVHDAPQGAFRTRVRVEWGWGGLGAGGFFDWQGAVRVRGGVIRHAIPHFQCAAFDEHRGNAITSLDERGCTWQSYTTRKDAWKGIATNSIVLELEAEADARLAFDFVCADQGTATFEVRLADLLRGNVVRKTSPAMTSPAVMIHRALTEPEFVICGSSDLWKGRGGGATWMRVTQRNGQMAWAGPVFGDGPDAAGA